MAILRVHSELNRPAVQPAEIIRGAKPPEAPLASPVAPETSTLRAQLRSAVALQPRTLPGPWISLRRASWKGISKALTLRPARLRHRRRQAWFRARAPTLGCQRHARQEPCGFRSHLCADSRRNS